MVFPYSSFEKDTCHEAGAYTPYRGVHDKPWYNAVARWLVCNTTTCKRRLCECPLDGKTFREQQEPACTRF